MAFEVDVNIRDAIASARTGVGAIAGGVALGNVLSDAIKPFFDGLMSVLRPMNVILGQLGKMVGELLRPITDVVVVLLQPILGLLRPIITVVRQVMAPFRAVALKLSGMAGESFARGDISEGLRYASSALLTITQPFFMLLSNSLIEIAQFVIDKILGVVQLIGSALDKLPWVEGVEDAIKRFRSDTNDWFDELQADILQKGFENVKALGRELGLSVEANIGVGSSAVQRIRNSFRAFGDILAEEGEAAVKRAGKRIKTRHRKDAWREYTAPQSLRSSTDDEYRAARDYIVGVINTNPSARAGDIWDDLMVLAPRYFG